MTDHTQKSGQNGQQTTSFARAKDGASDAARRAAHSMEANPLAVVAGSLAVGVIAGALLPRSPKEKELLAPVGKRLGEAARQAIAAAKDASRQELDGAGLTPGAARDRGKELLGGIGKALSSAGTAAAQAAKDSASKEDRDSGSSGQGGAGQGGAGPQGAGSPTQTQV